MVIAALALWLDQRGDDWGRLQVVIAFPAHQLGEAVTSLMMWDNPDCNLSTLAPQILLSLCRYLAPWLSP